MKRCRARELGVEIGSLPTGEMNAITDVKGVGVGHSTIIEGDSVRTGVTAIVPHQGDLFRDKVTAAVDILNGYGKAVGLSQIIYEGNIETPIMLTETLNTYRVADHVIDYYHEVLDSPVRSLNAVVGETNGAYLTDNKQRNIGKQHVYQAINIARSKKGQGPVPEGNVGAGTPMTGFGFKGGIGTSSRKAGDANIGVLVQLNCGRKDDLVFAGVPVGKMIKLPVKPEPSPGNSIMMIVACDVEMDSRQLWKVAKRTSMGLARTGAYSSNGSGDFTIAFTTGSLSMFSYKESLDLTNPLIRDGALSPIYKATAEATEEAILNALCKAEPMTGHNGNTRHAIPLAQVQKLIRG